MWRKTLLFYKNVPTKKFHLCESSTYVKSITLNLMGKKNVPDKKFHLTECSTYVSSTYVKSTVFSNCTMYNIATLYSILLDIFKLHYVKKAVFCTCKRKIIQYS